MVQQSIYDLVHKDDRETFRRQLWFSVGPDPDLDPGAESKRTVSLRISEVFDVDLSGPVQRKHHTHRGVCNENKMCIKTRRLNAADMNTPS